VVIIKVEDNTVDLSAFFFFAVMSCKTVKAYVAVIFFDLRNIKFLQACPKGMHSVIQVANEIIAVVVIVIQHGYEFCDFLFVLFV
jgi:hypothetical protein